MVSALQKQLYELGVRIPGDFTGELRRSRSAFGTLLAIDLYGCASAELGSVDVGYHFLDQMTVILRMQKQSPPFVFLSDAERFPDKAGLSGWVPLIESGISLHTILPAGFATVDVYSCGHVPVAEVIAYSITTFCARRVEAVSMCRGHTYAVPRAAAVTTA
jgi:S-adenosylmethionine/arginine decarboxylase-like enzyme